LTISNVVMAPDGYLTNMTVVNGQFPGPTIEADWGDTIRELTPSAELPVWSNKR
jgi:FtsP/CotA-like multicopper oxidase with cupredoxin domain